MRALHAVVGVVVLVALIGIPSPAHAQATLDVRWEKNGIVRVSHGRTVKRIDLGRDISGCIGRLFDSSTGQRFGSGLHDAQVLDVASVDGHHYVLVSAVAAPNCNVQGQCGAADDDVTLIWLDVGADLALVRKDALEVEQCPTRYVEGLPENWQSNLKLVAGSLKVNYTETRYDPDTRSSQEFSVQAQYDHRRAAEGIRITRVAK